MSRTATRGDQTAMEQAQSAPTPPRGRLLVVEPDPLTLWSLVTYLRRWFEVQATSTASQAQEALSARPADALVVSEDLPNSLVDAVERCARRGNPRVAVIRTVTEPSASVAPAPGALRLEKPFQLACLARMLGVPQDAIRDE